MRTLLLTLSAILISIVTMISCTKEKSETATPAAALSDEQLVGQVHWFMEAAKDVKEGKYLKSGEKMVLDSAIYYIGNTLNYKYGFVSEPYAHMIYDTAEIVIPFLSNEGKAYLVDVLDCYNITVTKLRQHYSQIINERKFLIGCVVNSTNWVVGHDSITISVIGRFGYGQPVTPSASLEGYWYERDSHNCENTIYDMGAPNYLDAEICFAMRPAPAPGKRITYINQDTETNAFSDPQEYENDDDDIPGDNFCDYNFYYADVPYNQITDELCCLGYDASHDIDELYFYRFSMRDELNEWLEDHDRDFVDIVTFHEYDGAFPQHTILKHYSYLTYGVKIIVTIGNEPYPISIMD